MRARGRHEEAALQPPQHMPDIAEILNNRLVGRVTIVGVGNPRRGDDGVGPLVIARLEGRTSALLIDAGETPESHVSEIAAWRPDVVLVVDAAALRSQPGSLELIESEHFGEEHFSTDTMVAFATVLEGETDCQVLAVGIQPRDTSLDAKMSPAVEEAGYGLVDLICACVPPDAAD